MADYMADFLDAHRSFTVLKHNRMTEIANENELPIVGLVQAVSNVDSESMNVFDHSYSHRPVCSSRSSFGSFTRPARCSGILHVEVRAGSRLAVSFLDHRQQVELICPVYQIIRSS